MSLGTPRHHVAEIGSTNDEARRLAGEGAPHGTVVTADLQTAGRGRQGRVWVAPAGRALTASVVLRDLREPELLPLQVAVAVARVVGDEAAIKWPNDVVLPPVAEGPLRKVAGVLCEGRPAEGWAVAGIGLNVALDLADVPAEIAERAATMGRDPSELDDVLADLLARLEDVLALGRVELLEAWSARDVLRGREVAWERPGGGAGAEGTSRADAEGVADGVDDRGRLLVRTAGGATVALDAGEVHLRRR